MIIETTANEFYQVIETGNPDLAHVWFGQRVKRVAGEFVPVKKIRKELVRKLGSKIIQEA
jgi:hypothetical protein